MNKKLFRFITSSIISISVIACNLPNNSTKSNSKLDSSLNKLSDSNTTDSEVVHDSDKLSKALSKDKNFFTRENKNSFKTLANHNDIECNPSGIATPEECVCEDSPNTLPDTSLPLTPESMGALNNELDIAKSPEAQELENFHSNLGKIHELENGVNQINAFLAQDKKDKAELEKQKNNPSFSTQSVKNNNKDKASKDKSDPRPHDCKATNPLDCFNSIDEKLAYLDKHIKLLEAKLVKEQTKLSSAQTKQDELFNKIDSSYRPYLISTGKKIREAARALNGKLYPRVNLFSTSNHNKRMDRLELFFNSSKLDFDFYVSAKNTYEMSKAGSVIGREFYIFDDMVYLFIRDGLTNADSTKYNVLASIKKYTRQIEEHLKQYKKENKKLIDYINKLKAQINSQGFRIQAESQAVADYNAATNFQVCLGPNPKPTPVPTPSGGIKDPIYPNKTDSDPSVNCPSEDIRTDKDKQEYDESIIVEVSDNYPGPDYSDISIVIRENGPNTHRTGFMGSKDNLFSNEDTMTSLLNANTKVYVESEPNKNLLLNTGHIGTDSKTTAIEVISRDNKQNPKSLTDAKNATDDLWEKKILDNLDKNSKNAPTSPSDRSNNKTVNKLKPNGDAKGVADGVKEMKCCIDARGHDPKVLPALYLGVIGVDLHAVGKRLQPGQSETLVIESKDKTTRFKLKITKKAPSSNNSAWSVECGNKKVNPTPTPNPN